MKELIDLVQATYVLELALARHQKRTPEFKQYGKCFQKLGEVLEYA